MTVEKFAIGMDINEVALDFARAKLGADHIHQLSVYATRFNATTVRRVQAVHGFSLTIIPDYILPSRYAWSAEFAGKAIWTEGP